MHSIIKITIVFVCILQAFLNITFVTINASDFLISASIVRQSTCFIEDIKKCKENNINLTWKKLRQ